MLSKAYVTILVQFNKNLRFSFYIIYTDYSGLYFGIVREYDYKLLSPSRVNALGLLSN